MTMERVTIVGLGQIGASIGMAIKRQKPKGVEIVGIDAEPETAGRARNKGAIDRIVYNLQEAVSEASLVILATPTTAACPEGITRATVLELCAAEGIEAREADLSLTEFYRADEVFCTGTMGELATVARFCLLYTSPSPRDATLPRMPSSA